MCRIGGYIGGHLTTKKTSILLRALLMAEEKGNPHGAGIVVRNSATKKAFIQKKGFRGRDFLVQGYGDFLWRTAYDRAFIHVRYMTSGEQSDRCAHPFGFRVNGKWHFAMHNGVFSGSICEAITEKFGCSKAQVDSETFFWALQELQNKGKSLEEAIKEVTEFVSADSEFAFAYMNHEGVIYLWRSEGRPLSVFDLREIGMGRWFASTKAMFEEAIKMSGVRVDKVSYFEIKPFRLYKVGHRTEPELEVEPICDLPRKQKPMPEPVADTLFPPSEWERMLDARRKAEAELGFDYGYDFEDPVNLTYRQLVNKIKKIKKDIDKGIWDWEIDEYLTMLEEELMYRDEIRKQKKPSLLDRFRSRKTAKEEEV